MSQSACKSPSLFWIKLLYLTVYSSYGTTSIYRTLYFRRVGLTGAEIGVLIALEPLVTLFAGPLWSLIADRFGLRARLLSVVTGLSIVPMVAMIWTQSFGALALLVALYALFMGPIQPLMDCIALSALGERRDQYGSIRAYGSLGYAPVTWITGLLIKGQDIRWTFAGYALLMGAGCLLSLRVRTQQGALATNLGTGLGGLARNRNWLIFMVAMFLAMMAQAVAYGYTGLYLDTLGADEGVIGFSQALASIGQTVMMMSILPWLLRRWGSRRLMVLSFLTYGLRFMIWAMVPAVGAVVASQTIMGLTYGAALVASVDFAASHAPPGMAATSQALVTGLVSGLGRSLGGIVGGPLYDGVGPQGTFAAYGVMSLLAAAVFGLVWRERRQEAKQAAQPISQDWR